MTIILSNSYCLSIIVTYAYNKVEVKSMKEEELKLLENEFCLGCARSCDLLHPNCERGLVKMQEILEEYKKRDN